jgi:hypothetical protein
MIIGPLQLTSGSFIFGHLFYLLGAAIKQKINGKEKTQKETQTILKSAPFLLGK